MEEKTYRLLYKDTDPDTGKKSEEIPFATIICTEKIVCCIIESLSWSDENPNREYTYDEGEKNS